MFSQILENNQNEFRSNVATEYYLYYTILQRYMRHFECYTCTINRKLATLYFKRRPTIFG